MHGHSRDDVGGGDHEGDGQILDLRLAADVLAEEGEHAPAGQERAAGQGDRRDRRQHRGAYRVGELAGRHPGQEEGAGNRSRTRTRHEIDRHARFGEDLEHAPVYEAADTARPERHACDRRHQESADG